MWLRLFTLVGHLGKSLTVLDCTHVSCVPCICVRRFNVLSFFICICIFIVWFQKISFPPPLWVVNENSYGVGGLKGRNFRGVWGVSTRKTFHRVVKDAIDPSRHTCIYGLFWLVAQQKLKVDALSRKKTSRCLSRTSSSLLGVCDHLRSNNLSTRSNDLF